jgi:hypothetical protein
MAAGHNSVSAGGEVNGAPPGSTPPLASRAFRPVDETPRRYFGEGRSPFRDRVFAGKFGGSGGRFGRDARRGVLMKRFLSRTPRPRGTSRIAAMHEQTVWSQRRSIELPTKTTDILRGTEWQRIRSESCRCSSPVPAGSRQVSGRGGARSPVSDAAASRSPTFRAVQHPLLDTRTK